MRGIIPVYKPSGRTSAEITSLLRQILLKGCSRTNKLKVGHAGTLDKSAEGVLVVGVGKDCKLLSHYLHGDKSYTAIGCLGISTTTYDSEGAVVKSSPCDHVTEMYLRDVVGLFCGKQRQVPPVYSALKFNGRRASDLIRNHIPVDMTTKTRVVNISELRLEHFSLPLFTIHVTCSSGTYIRSLVHDIGIAAGTVVHVKELYRTKQGLFTVENAIKEEQWNIECLSKFLTE